MPTLHMPHRFRRAGAQLHSPTFERNPSLTTALGVPQQHGSQGLVREGLFTLAFVASYILAAQVGWHFRPAPSVTMIWPPLGLSLALLFVRGCRRAWVVVVFADLVSSLLLPAPPPRLPWLTFPLFTCANTLAPVGAVWMLSRTSFDASLSRLADVFRFLFIGALGASAVSATLGVFAEIVAYGASTSLREMWITWFAGDFMGAMVVAPFALTWARREPLDLRPKRIVEAVVLFTLLIAAALADFGGAIASSERSPLLYAIFPFVMWAALRFGLRGAATAHLIACMIAVGATARGQGPFVQASFAESLFYLHCFTAVIVMTSLMLGAATAEREHALTETGQKAAELQAVLTSISDAILVCDANHLLTLINPAGAEITGFHVGESILKANERIAMRSFAGDAVPPDQVPLVRALDGETSNSRPLSFQIPGKERVFVHVNASPIVDTRGIVGAVSVVRDVTERLEFERMKDEFLSVAAHELKTPVTIQKVTAQALLRQGAEGVTRRRLEAIDRGADRVARVVQDMLDVSQIHLGSLAMQMGDVDLGAIARAVATALGTSRQIVVSGANSVVVRGDKERIEQVIRNLVQNSIHHTKSGDRIAIEIDVDDERARLSVVDHGVGIPLEKQARIFERFFRAHQGTEFDRGGVGVGLYVSREIVHRHDGRMWFTSEPGRGSTFVFELPCATARAADDEPDARRERASGAS